MSQIDNRFDFDAPEPAPRRGGKRLVRREAPAKGSATSFARKIQILAIILVPVSVFLCWIGWLMVVLSTNAIALDIEKQYHVELRTMKSLHRDLREHQEKLKGVERRGDKTGIIMSHADIESSQREIADSKKRLAAIDTISQQTLGVAAAELKTVYRAEWLFSGPKDYHDALALNAHNDSVLAMSMQYGRALSGIEFDEKSVKEAKERLKTADASLAKEDRSSTFRSSYELDVTTAREWLKECQRSLAESKKKLADTDAECRKTFNVPAAKIETLYR